ncbi:MAG TPA: nitrilase-related carbon-nitrogen hydrolase [Nocardioidaceae bacterium]|nr:nitrilase-related carbon-nitrogen hydrolase [Nocardioidaceae bacterium]
MTTVKIAAVQAAYVLMDQKATLSKAIGLLEQAAADGAEIVVFPEVFVPGTPIWIDSVPIWDGDADWYALLVDQIPADFPHRDRIWDKERHGEWVEEGNAVIVDPGGQILAGPAREEETILTADIDLTAVRAARRLFDPTGHYHRPDIFQLTVDTRPRSAVNVVGPSPTEPLTEPE